MFWLVLLYALGLIWGFYAFVMFSAKRFFQFREISEGYIIRYDKPMLFRFLAQLWGLMLLLAVPSAGMMLIATAPAWVLVLMMIYFFGKVWRRQGYSRWVLWGMTTGWGVLAILMGRAVRGLVVGSLF